jgi:hypothetical protein
MKNLLEFLLVHADDVGRIIGREGKTILGLLENCSSEPCRWLICSSGIG